MTHEPDDWYSLPGGGMLHGSDIEMTLKRELQEEIGLEPANIQVDPRIIDAKFGTVSRGIPRANVYVRVRLADYTQVHDSELEHLWATEEDLDQLLLSPSTSKIVELLKNLLRE